MEFAARKDALGVPNLRGTMKSRFLLLVLLPLVMAGVSGAEQSRSRPRRVAVHEAAAAQPAPPPVVLRPEQMPAVPPEITFSGGNLTINAPNSTLGDILRAVRNQTGATVDVPGNATERVIGRFGPGPARDVLTTLLNGTHFNYVLMGSETDPGALMNVILTAKSSGEPANNQEASAAPPANQPPPQAPANGAPDDFFGGAGDQSSDDSSENIFGTDDQSGSDDQQAQSNPFGQPQQPTDSRTPEQMLQDLQRQQQTQQGFAGQQQPGQPPQGPFPTPGRPFRGIPNPGTPGTGTQSPSPEPQ